MLLVFAIVVGALALLALWRPWCGVLAYTWVSLMYPHRLLGGELYDFPAAKYLAVATLLGLLFTRQWRPLPNLREVWLIGVFWVVCVASTLFAAFEPELARQHLVRFSKALVMLVVILLLLQDGRRLQIWLTTIALSLGALGVITGVRALATGLTVRQFGPENSVFGDNNALAFALAMASPLLAFRCKQEKRGWLKGSLLLALVLTLVALPSTYSRGGMVTLWAVLPLTLWLVRDRLVRVCCIVTVLLVSSFTPKPLQERMATIRPDAYRVDSSGSERMKSWYVALRIGLDHPVLGAGFRPFSEDVYERYIPGYRDFHNAHNHFLQVFAEQGFTGLGLFVGLLVSTLWRLRALVQRTRADPALGWIADQARMLALSLGAYIVGGVFLNQPYLELLYWLLAAAVLLEVVSASAGSVDNGVVGESMLRVFWRRLRSTA